MTANLFLERSVDKRQAVPSQTLIQNYAPDGCFNQCIIDGTRRCPHYVLRIVFFRQINQIARPAEV